MMKRISRAMQERGEQAEYLYCSGDSKSLDGVHIPRIKVAVVDGTSIPTVLYQKDTWGRDRLYHDKA